MFDLGLVLVRVPAGTLLAAHGTQKLFGWFDGAGPQATGEAFESLGYPRGREMAVLAGLTEVGAGAGLALGAFTPLTAAAAIGTMTNAAVAAHSQAGLWNQNGGYEYPLVLATIAAGLAFHGPGRPSVDTAFGSGHTGLGWGLSAIGLGLSAAAATLSTRRRTSNNAPE